MTRVLFWVALALLVYFAIRSKIKQSQRRQQPPPQPPPSSTMKQVAPPEAMLCCAQCGVYYPASENVPAGGRDYCSPAHAPLQ